MPTFDSNGASPDRKGGFFPPTPIPEENHKPKRRGYFIPIDVWNLAESGKLSWSDIRLLMIIDSFVSSEGAGCWASVAYLGKRIGRSGERVRHMIKELMGLNLLVQVGTVTVRNLKYNILETSFSRAVPLKETFEEAKDRIEKSIRKQAKCPVSVNLTPAKPEAREPTPAKPDLSRPAKPSRGTPGEVSRENTDTSYQRIGNVPEGEGRSAATPPSADLKDGLAEYPPQDTAAAAHLRKTLRDNNRQVRNPNDSTKWAGAFRLLREHDKQDYDAVLEWYCSLTNEEVSRLGLPALRSGAEFRARYDWVSDKYRRTLPPPPEEVEPPVVLSELAGYVLQDLTSGYSFQGSEAQLPAAVQKSLDWFTEFQRRLYLVGQARGETDTIGGLAHYAWAYYDKGGYVTLYYATLARRVAGWEEWSGKIPVLSYTDKYFLKKGRALARDYCYTPGKWDELVALLKGMTE